MKVIHVPKNVGGNPYLISKFLNKINIKSTVWVYEDFYFNYPADKIILDKKDGILLREIKKFLALRYIFQNDTIFFNYGAGLYPPYFTLEFERYSVWKKPLVFLYCLYINVMSRVELFLLKILKRKIFIQYQGDDARQGDFCKKNFSINIADNVDELYYSSATDKMKRKQIELYGKVSSKIYSLNPDLLHVLPKNAEFLPYMGQDLKSIQPKFIDSLDRPIRFGHAPSHRGVKGTDLIIEAFEKLRKENSSFEFILIENMAHGEAMKTYESLDVLIDQLFAGWYGGIAVELMSLGKPVISYIRESDLGFIPTKMKEELPIIKSSPDDIYQTIKQVIQMNKSDLRKIALRSREFVEDWHNPETIAKRISNDLHSSWSR